MLLFHQIRYFSSNLGFSSPTQKSYDIYKVVMQTYNQATMQVLTFWKLSDWVSLWQWHVTSCRSWPPWFHNTFLVQGSTEPRTRRSLDSERLPQEDHVTRQEEEEHQARVQLHQAKVCADYVVSSSAHWNAVHIIEQSVLYVKVIKDLWIKHVRDCQIFMLKSTSLSCYLQL